MTYSGEGPWRFECGILTSDARGRCFLLLLFHWISNSGTLRKRQVKRTRQAILTVVLVDGPYNIVSCAGRDRGRPLESHKTKLAPSFLNLKEISCIFVL